MTEDDGSMKFAPPDAAPRRATAMDVARAAGVSRSAVSRAFSQTAYLDTDKRDHIRRIAAEMGYRPNALAAGLNRTRSNLVGIVAGDVGNLYDAQLLSRLVSGLTAAGKWPVVLDGSVGADRLVATDIFAYPLDAMIVRGGSVDPVMVDTCAKLHIPLVFLGCVVDAPAVDSIVCRNAEGMARIADLLLNRGRRRFAFLGGPAQWASQQQRLQGLCDALAQAGLELIATESADFSHQGGAKVARRLLQDHDLDALVCANDAMAIGALGVARHDLGLNVPADLSITGFDDVDMASWPCFDLTTACNPVEETVAGVIELLEARLAAPSAPSRRIQIDAHLVRRGTH